MEIKGSGNKYYEVNLDDLTCTCRDWTCRRHNFSKNDKRRLCKHLSEAIEISSTMNTNSMILENSKPMNTSEVIRLSDALRNEDIILKYSVCGEYYRRCNYQTEFLPIVVKLTYNEIPRLMIDNIFVNLGYTKVRNSVDENIRYYNGVTPLLVLICNENFLFQSIFYELTKDQFIRLSSISYRKLNIKLTKDGFVNNENKLIDMKVSTENEICELLGIDSLIG